MDDTPDPPGKAAAAGVTDADRDLERVQRKIEAARAVLVRLLQQVVVAEARVSQGQTALLLEANEALVQSALRDQSRAQTAAQALAEAARTAGIDPLTQLPNRVLLQDRFAHDIATAKRRGSRLALLFVDLDEFKQINDTLGHAAGDETLQHVARLLTSTVREADTVSRHGGDEFLILLADISHPADAARIAAKVQAALDAPVQLAGRETRLKASIGISVYPDDGQDVKTLIARADAAMYRAKQIGPGRFAFHGEAPARPGSLLPPPAIARGLTLAEHAHRNSQLQEANERLLLATLDAQALQAAAERAQKRQAEFIAAVAEELGSPQSPIRLATAMLGRARTDEPLLPRVLDIIERQVNHMSWLVAAAGKRSGQPGAAAQPLGQFIDIVGVIDAAVRSCAAVIDLRRQSLTVTLPPGPIAVGGDPARLELILGNLLDNASKYTPDQGAIRLDAKVEGTNIVIAVSDDGIGISPEAVPRIFEPFAQDSHAIGFNGIGQGIGLPVVRVLVQEQGGTVSVASDGSGRGSRFVVTLPLAQRQATLDLEPAPPASGV